MALQETRFRTQLRIGQGRAYLEYMSFCSIARKYHNLRRNICDSIPNENALKIYGWSSLSLRDSVPVDNLTCEKRQVSSLVWQSQLYAMDS